MGISVVSIHTNVSAILDALENELFGTHYDTIKYTVDSRNKVYRNSLLTVKSTNQIPSYLH